MDNLYLDYLNDINKKLIRNGVRLPLDLSVDNMHIFSQIRILEDYTYFNHILEICDSGHKIESLVCDSEVSYVEWLKKQIKAEYEGIWAEELSRLVVQPDDAGVLNANVKVLDSKVSLITKSEETTYEDKMSAIGSFQDIINLSSQSVSFEDDELEDTDEYEVEADDYSVYAIEESPNKSGYDFIDDEEEDDSDDDEDDDWGTIYGTDSSVDDDEYSDDDEDDDWGTIYGSENEGAIEDTQDDYNSNDSNIYTEESEDSNSGDEDDVDDWEQLYGSSDSDEESSDDSEDDEADDWGQLYGSDEESEEVLDDDDDDVDDWEQLYDSDSEDSPEDSSDDDADDWDAIYNSDENSDSDGYDEYSDDEDDDGDWEQLYSSDDEEDEYSSDDEDEDEDDWGTLYGSDDDSEEISDDEDDDEDSDDWDAIYNSDNSSEDEYSDEDDDDEYDYDSYDDEEDEYSEYDDDEEVPDLSINSSYSGNTINSQQIKPQPTVRQKGSEEELADSLVKGVNGLILLGIKKLNNQSGFESKGNSKNG